MVAGGRAVPILVGVAMVVVLLTSFGVALLFWQDVSALNQRRERLLQEQDDVQREIDRLNQENEGLRDDNTNIKEELDKAEELLTNLRSDVSSLEEEGDKLNKSVSTLQKTISQKRRELQAKKQQRAATRTAELETLRRENAELERLNKEIREFLYSECVEHPTAGEIYIAYPWGYWWYRYDHHRYRYDVTRDEAVEIAEEYVRDSPEWISYGGRDLDLLDVDHVGDDWRVKLRQEGDTTLIWTIWVDDDTGRVEEAEYHQTG